MVPTRPPGYHSVTPYIIVVDAPAALQFYATALGAVEVMRLQTPEGMIVHAEIRIGDSIIMLAEEMPEYGCFAPSDGQVPPVYMMVYVDDCDAVMATAVAAGAKIERPLTDQFYGDRSGTISDPFGHHWTIATHKEDVSPEDLAKRFDAYLQQGG
jgi:PhnB protein